MEHRVDDVRFHYVEHGEGVPLVALHGAGVDHRDVAVAFEGVVPKTGCRRIYPDLPGMGRSTSGRLACNDDVVGALIAFIDHVGPGRCSSRGIPMAVTSPGAWPAVDQTWCSGRDAREA